ncbi:E3 ubiquitin-protein ligase hrd1 [Ascosphaera pollenicola]|nr:E3 ubiquitin-protein ligase hrd1 [Ascosphaera pollenicola]
MRLALSLAAAGAVLLGALHQRANVYSACVYLSQSNANLMILTNMAIVMVAWSIYGLQRALYGPLRPVEREQLYDRAWFAVTETCLAMTIFRGEVGAWFVVMFGSLVIGKIWGWIGEGRVDTVEQRLLNDAAMWNSRYSLYIRLAISLSISVVFNSFMLDYCVKVVLRQARPDMMVMFGFEFAILLILSLSTFCRYCMAIYEVHIVSKQKELKREEERTRIREERKRMLEEAESSGSTVDEAILPSEDDINDLELDVVGWEEKGRWTFGLNLLTDFFKIIVYTCFFAILFTFYGLPIHIIRDMIFTLRSFVKRIVDFSRYRRATRDMNRRYQDATPEELRDADVCIICREEMQPWQDNQENNNNNRQPTSERWRPKKLPCGHILHFACLRSWLERQQNCPTCRRPVTEAAPSAAGAGRAQAGGDNAAGGNPPNAQGEAGDRPAVRGLDGVPRARAWFLNLGPLRIGLGAGRDIIPNLAHQVRRQHEVDQQQRREQRQQLQQQAQLLGQQQRQDNINETQRNTEGTAGDGTQPTTTDTASSSDSIAGLFTRPAGPSAQPFAAVPNMAAGGVPMPPLTVSQTAQWQLAQIEYQIEQELGALRATQEQLQIVRLLQGELNRLRAARTDLQQQQQVAQPSSSTGAGSSSTARTTPYTAQRFVSQPRENAIPSGDVRLPTGVTIPQGWTLLPMREIPSGQAAPPTAPVQPTPTSAPIPSVVTPAAPLQNVSNLQTTDPSARDERSAQTPASNHQTDNEPTPVASRASTFPPPPQGAGPSLPLNERTLAPFSFGEQEQPLAPEVRSREGDQPIPRDDSTSSSVDDFDDFRQQEPDNAAAGRAFSMENNDARSLEPVPVTSGGSHEAEEVRNRSSSEKRESDPSTLVSNEGQGVSSSTPSREEKGKYRATVEDDDES